MNDFYQHPWVIFALKKERYAVPTTHVQTMVAMPEVVPVPKAPTCVRGVINLRGQTSPLIDLRRRLGMDSSLDVIQAQVAMLHEREEDHRHWLNELELSVKEGREFTLTTDCHKCKFGQWYDAYTPKSFIEGQFLKKFERPHQRIHEIAIEVELLVTGGRQAEAEALIRQTHDQELAEMIHLFERFREMTERQAASEIALVLERQGSRAALAVDSIITVERLAADSVEDMPEVALAANEGPVARYIAKTGKDRSLVYLLDPETILSEAHTG